MAVSRRSGRSRFTLVLLVLTSITLLTLDFRGLRTHRVRPQPVPVVLRAGRRLRHRASSAPSATPGTGRSRRATSQAENDDLRRQIDELRSQVAVGEAAIGELEALKARAGLDTLADTDGAAPRSSPGRCRTSTTRSRSTRARRRGIAGGHAGAVEPASWSGTVVTVAENRADGAARHRPRLPGRRVGRRRAGQGHRATVRATSQTSAASQLLDHHRPAAGATCCSPAARPAALPAGYTGGHRHVSVPPTTRTQQKTADVELLANMDDLTYVTVAPATTPTVTARRASDRPRSSSASVLVHHLRRDDPASGCCARSPSPACRAT